MKKILSPLLLIITLLTLGCGSNTSTEPAAENPNTINGNAADGNAAAIENAPAPTKNADGFIFMYNGSPVYMDENMSDVKNKIGEPRREFEMPSCAFDGIDRIFAYPGVEIHTYPSGESDFVHTVNYKDDSFGTPENIYLGSSQAEMLAAYGSDYEQELGLYTYTKGNTYLSFLIDENETVITITYGLLF